eukprot:1519870-Amphidinium_carterae.1
MCGDKAKSKGKERPRTLATQAEAAVSKRLARLETREGGQTSSMDGEATAVQARQRHADMVVAAKAFGGKFKSTCRGLNHQQQQ